MSIQEYFDSRVLNKYNQAGPRYTSYPTALYFKQDVELDKLVERALSMRVGSVFNLTGQNELSLYIHIPFCHSLCYYCGCNKIVTRHAHKADEYLAKLRKEIAMQAAKCADMKVSHVHLGGGTPSFLNKAQLAQLLADIHYYFNTQSDVDMSIEIDPRNIALDYVIDLVELGFSRLSIGVQDTDQNVQKAINREQSTAFIADLVQLAKVAGFASVNLDLIYGLPLQTQQTMQTSLQEVLKINPDRISLFSYAHLPAQFAAQRKIKEQSLPTPESKLAIFQLAIQTLSDAGYQFIGMDHFAKPKDELAIAAGKGQLTRNFQGYCIGKTPNILGLGVSAISSINNVYAQNCKDLTSYYKMLDEDTLPTIKGLELSEDDLLRRHVIQSLMCNFQVNKLEVGSAFNIFFDTYFAKELEDLTSFESDGLLSIEHNKIVVHDKGRLLIRNICMSFDAYLSHPAHRMRYSRVI